MSSVARPAIERPSKRISPLVSVIPVSERSVVVLPAPLAPRSVVMPPLDDLDIDAVQHLDRAVIGIHPLCLEEDRRHFLSVPR